MLNYLWPILIIIGFIYSIVSGNIEILNESILNSSKNAIKLSINLLGIICMWSGIIEIIRKTSLINKISKIMEKPLMYIFQEIKENKEILNEISLNMVSNIFGIGNASTVLGINIMKKLQKINKNKKELSKSMITFIIINATSIQLIPNTIIGIRVSLNSVNPMVILAPIWCISVISLMFSIVLTKIITRERKRI